MAPFDIVPALYPFEDGVGKLGTCFPCAGIEDLELQGSPERLHHRVVVTIANRTHRREQPVGAEALPESPGRELPGLNRSSQHLDREVRYGAKAKLGRGNDSRPPMRSPGRPPAARKEHRRVFWTAISQGATS